MNNYDNVIIYNGENITDINIKYCVTKSIENLFNSCKCIYDHKIYRSPNCIWYILSKNIPENIIITIIENTIRKAFNSMILKNELKNNPNILQNIIIPVSTYLYFFPIIYYNIYNITNTIINTEYNSTSEIFDILE
jgi:hypothetical protein